MTVHLAFERVECRKRGDWTVAGTVHLARGYLDPLQTQRLLCGKKVSLMFGDQVPLNFPVSCSTCREQAALEALI